MYIFLIRIITRVDLAMSVRINSEISETLRARLLGFGMQIPELLAQRKFTSAGCHSHFNARAFESLFQELLAGVLDSSLLKHVLMS